MRNSYYRSESDKIWDRFKENSNGHASFYDEVRDYLLEEHGSNFTQFIEICSPPYCNLDYWEQMAEEGKDPKQVVDDVFQDEQVSRQMKYINNVVLGD